MSRIFSSSNFAICNDNYDRLNCFNAVPAHFFNRSQHALYEGAISTVETQLEETSDFMAEIKNINFTGYSPEEGYSVTVEYEIRAGFSSPNYPVNVAVVVTQDNVSGQDFYQYSSAENISSFFDIYPDLNKAKGYADEFFFNHPESSIGGDEMVYNDVNRGIWPNLYGETFNPNWKRDIPVKGQIYISGLKGVEGTFDPLIKSDLNFVLLVLDDEINAYNTYPIIASDIRKYGDDTNIIGDIITDENSYEYVVSDANMVYLAGLPANTKALEVRDKFTKDGVTYNVCGVLRRALFGHEDIETATIPGSIGEIRMQLFKDLTSLREVYISEGITSIADGAFLGCTSLRKIHLPESLTHIWDKAFANCNQLEEVVLPPNMEVVGENAFESCQNLIKAAYPVSLCNPFTRGIRISYPLDAIILDTGVIVDKQLSKIYYAPIDLEGEYCISSSVSEIYFDAFNRCNMLTSVKMPDNLATVGARAFRDCTRLTSVIFNSNLSSIGDDAFNGCYRLVDLNMPDKLTTIGARAFRDCTRLTSVNFNRKLVSIGDEAFYGDFTLSALRLYDKMESVGDRAFAGCTQIKDIVVEEGKGQIVFGENALPEVESLYIGKDFSSKGIFCQSVENLRIGNNVTMIGDGGFANCNIKTLSLGSSVKNIGDRAFENCSISELIMSPSTEIIGDYAFYGCSLTSVALGANVKHIGKNAFGMSKDADAVYITATTPPSAPNDAFNIYSMPLYITPGYEDVYDDYPTCWFRFNFKPMVVAKQVSIDEGTKILQGKEGDSFQLNAQIYPKNSSLTQIFWKSSDPNVATVDQFGRVTIIGANTIMPYQLDNISECLISAETLYSDIPLATCEIRVSEAVSTPLATSISIEPNQINSKVDVEFQLQVTILPEEASSQMVVWTSSDSEIASVSQTGKVNVHSPGYATITASTTDGSNLSASCLLDITLGDNTIYGEDRFIIYTVTGILLKANATDADLRSLHKGVYIVNGRKFIKR